jgi:hypothetical protein
LPQSEFNPARDFLCGVARKRIIFERREVSISHLAQMPISCWCDQLDHSISISVKFSHHCFTEAFDASRHDRQQIVLYERGGRARIFCPIRHKLSFRLPDIVKGLPDQRVYQTPQSRNYVYVVPTDISGQTYNIFFMLQRADGDLFADLRMTVESAYPSDGSGTRSKRPNSIRFKVLAYKVLRREPVRFAPR